jgi:hypothetical protein
LYYVALDASGQWVALLVFSAAAKHLKHRDRWIGWTPKQRSQRLSLVVNNSRFLLLPDKTVPNLGSKVLRLTLERLSKDWQSRYDHPVSIVESFVDPERFCGTVYTANGWTQLGQTDGWGRCSGDYYVQHNKPKKLFVRELCRNARRSLQAEHLKASLAGIEKKHPPVCPYRVCQIQSMRERFMSIADFRQRIESYPLWSLLTLLLLATLCDAPRGQKDLVKFARRLTQPQRRAVGIRRNRQGYYPVPSQSTFCRLLQRVDGKKVNEVILEIQRQFRAAPSGKELIVLDGKEPSHGSGESVLTAVEVPSQQYLGSAMVDIKTNEIPVARQLFAQLDLQGRIVAMDALHTQHQTARELVMEHGADYVLTVKKNQPTLLATIQQIVPAPEAGFSPSGSDGTTSPNRGTQQEPYGKSNHRNPSCER